MKATCKIDGWIHVASSSKCFHVEKTDMQTYHGAKDRYSIDFEIID
jgi:hypothetical protein